MNQFGQSSGTKRHKDYLFAVLFFGLGFLQGDPMTARHIIGDGVADHTGRARQVSAPLQI